MQNRAFWKAFNSLTYPVIVSSGAKKGQLPS